MKKLISLFLAAAMILALAGCSGGAPAQSETSLPPASESASESAPESGESEAPESPEAAPEATGVTMKVAALRGPTAMGMVKLMEDAAQGTTANGYEFTLAGSPDEILGRIIQGEFDAAAVPTNLAATLYNRTGGQVRLLALNTLGVLYILENGEAVQSVADLAGRTVYATGKGSTPEYALNYILAQNGLVPGEDVAVEYRTEHAELAALLSQGQADLALLPQPFVSTVLAQNPDVRVALDMTEEWDKASGGAGQLTMGCVVVQDAFLQEHPEAVEAFLAEYRASVDFVTDPAELEAAAELIAGAEIVASPEIAAAALPQCGIVFLTGEEMKTAASGFLSVLYEADPQSVGGTLPDDSLYVLP